MLKTYFLSKVESFFKRHFEKILLITCGIFFLAIFSFQVYHTYEFNKKLNSFVNKSPRFTAHDGQVLCERLRKLEEKVYTKDMLSGNKCEFEKVVIP